MANLRVVNLNTNLITMVEEGAFNGCTGLVELRMNNNFLAGDTLPATLFRSGPCGTAFCFVTTVARGRRI